MSDNKNFSKTGLILTIIVSIILVFSVIVGGYVFSQWKQLAMAQQTTKTAWSQVENQMQRRSELIDQLVGVVSGYSNHELDAIKAVTDARSKLAQAQAPVDKNEANTALAGSLNRLLMVQENYPNLKADKQFSDLATTIEGSQNRITTAITRYTMEVDKYDMIIVTPPSSFIAPIFGFTYMEQFKADESAHTAPKIDFSKKTGDGK